MKKEFKIDDIHKIVIFRTDRIGEVMLSTPVISVLKKNFPNTGLSFVTSSYSSELVSSRKDLEEVLTFNTLDRKVPVWEAIDLGLMLRKKKFDMAVVLNPHKALHIAVFLAGIPFRFGFDRKCGFLLTHKMKDTRYEGKMHEVEYNLKLLDIVHIKERNVLPSINIREVDKNYITALFEQHHINKEKKTVMINPGTSNPAKQWPAENFSELIKDLAGLGDMNIILVGDKSEKGLCQSIKAMAGNKAFNLAGYFKVGQLAALYDRADLLITNDNGPMHIAAATGTKVIAIFGRNIPGVSPVRWGPYGEGHIVFHKDPGCSPCYDKDCPFEFKCLKAITPGAVFDAAKKILWGRVPKGQA